MRLAVLEVRIVAKLLSLKSINSVVTKNVTKWLLPNQNFVIVYLFKKFKKPNFKPKTFQKLVFHQKLVLTLP